MERKAFPIKMTGETQQLLNDDGKREEYELQPVRNPTNVQIESQDGDSSCVIDFVKQHSVDIDRLKTLLRSPAEVDFVDHEGKTALHWAALRGKADVVDVLLEVNATIKRDHDGNTALHYAVESPAFDVFKRLLPPRQPLENKLDSTFRNEKQYQRRMSGIYKLTTVNAEGFNVLDLALKDLKYQKRKIVEYIVRETDDDCLLRLLRNNTNLEGNFSSPFRELIRKMPEMAKEVMDKFITSREENKITFNYEILDDTYFLKHWPVKEDLFAAYWEHRICNEVEQCKEYTNNPQTLKNNHPLKLMIKCRKKDITNDGIYQQLLDHPLVKALVRRKWKHIGVKLHGLNLVLYVIFLLVLTMCVSFTVPPNSLIFPSLNTTACQNVTLCQNETSCQNGNICKNKTICRDATTCLNESTTEDAVTNVTCHAFERNRNSVHVIVYMQHVVITLAVIMILKELYKLVRTYRCKDYFRQIENYAAIVIYISSVVFVLNLTECENTDYRTIWQWGLGTFSVFMAWINLLSFARKFDRLGIYVMMLWSIIKTFMMTVLPIVAVLLMALSIPFTSLLRDKEGFENLWYSILKILTMLIGGADFKEFLSLYDNYSVAFLSYMFYGLFQSLMTILVINLMVGVAVENVKKIHKDASDMNTVLQIEYTLELEAAIICVITPKLENTCYIRKFKKWFILKPIEEVKLTQLKSTRLPVQQIMDLIDKNKAENQQAGILERMNQIEKQIMKQMTEINSMTERQLAQLNATTNETNERMNTVQTKQNELNSTINETNERMNTVQTKQNELNSTTNETNERINTVQTKQNELNSTTKKTNERMKTIETKLIEQNSTTKETNERMTTVVTKMNELESTLKTINEKMNTADAPRGT